MTKKLPTAKAVEAARLAEDIARKRAIVDEYGRLKKQLAAVQPQIARSADLAKSIRSWCADLSPTEGVTVEGEEFVCILGACGLESRIADMQAVHTALGHTQFIAYATMTLKALEAAGGDVGALTVKEQTGARSLTVSQRALSSFTDFRAVGKG